MRATRSDGKRGTKGSLNRGEFYEMILRCVTSLHVRNISEHLDEFLLEYVQPIYDNSRILKERQMMRKCQTLN